MSQYELFEATSIYLDLCGDAFWYLTFPENSRKPIMVDLVAPWQVEVAIVERPENGLLPGDVSGYIVTNSKGQQIPVKRDEMVHFKTFNPENPYRGLSAIEAGWSSIQIDKSTSEFQQSFMENNATPSSIVALKGNIGSDVFNKVKKMFSEKYGGTSNAGKTLFIKDTEIDIKKLGLSLAELDLKQLKDTSAQRIRSLFGTPRFLLGDNEGGGLSRANIYAEEYAFQKYEIEPVKTRLDDQLRLACQQIWPNEQLKVVHETDIISDKEQELAEDSTLVNTVLTVNEVRLKRGLEEIEGGDQLYIPFNQVALDAPKVEQTAKSIKIKKTIKKSAPTIFEQTEKIVDAYYPRMLKALRTWLDKQEHDVISFMERQSGQKSVQRISDDKFESILVSNPLVDLIQALLLQILSEGGSLAGLLVGPPDFTFVVDQVKQESIFDATQRLQKSFDDLTVQKLQQQIGQALEENMTVDQLKARIEIVFDEAKGYRAERIARTELQRATNEGIAEGYKQSGYNYIEWIAEPDACEFCQEMNGTVKAIGTPFLNEGDELAVDGVTTTANYGDVLYATMHPNCRCSIAPVEESALKSLPEKTLKLNDNKYVEHLETENDQLAKSLSEQADYLKELEKIAGLTDGQQ